MSSSDPNVLHLHTYFLFPVSIDQAAVMEEHPAIWRGSQSWFEKLDLWVTGHIVPEYRSAAERMGRWQRHPETCLDLHSPTYQDMMFFHPFVRRAFFDTGDSHSDHDALVHRYLIPIDPGCRIFLEAEDGSGESARVEVSDLRLLMFANGVGILSIGVEARNMPYSCALWVNEMMRKIYPSSGRQIETARIPNRTTLVKETSADREIIAEERWDIDLEQGYRPPLSRILRSLLHFANYSHEEFEIALDERMIVNSFVSLDRTSVLPGYESSEDYEIAFSRLLYVDRAGLDFRYNPSFLHEQMKKCVYRRWQHDGTLYGTTAYSNVTSVLRSPEDSGSEEIVHRMFSSKHLLLAVIALFYRTSLLDFAKESALVSRQLLPIFTGKTVRHRHILLATRLMADFHYFNNYWFHPEPTTKDEELEHFALLCHAYQLAAAKQTIEDRVDKLAGYIDRLFALRNNDAVNRLAMMSVILGIGALVTGYFGMNIPHLETILRGNAVSLSTLVLTSLMAVASLWFVVYIIVSNWLDYRASIFPHRYRRPLAAKSLRRLRNYGIERKQGPSEESPEPLTPQG